MATYSPVYSKLLSFPRFILVVFIFGLKIPNNIAEDTPGNCEDYNAVWDEGSNTCVYKLGEPLPVKIGGISLKCPQNAKFYEHEDVYYCMCDNPNFIESEVGTCLPVVKFGNNCNSSAVCNPLSGLSCLNDHTCGCKKNAIWNAEDTQCYSVVDCNFGRFYGAFKYDAELKRCVLNKLDTPFKLWLRNNYGMKICPNNSHLIVREAGKIGGSPYYDPYETEQEQICTCDDGYTNIGIDVCIKRKNRGEICTGEGEICDVHARLTCISGRCGCLSSTDWNRNTLTCDSDSDCNVVHRAEVSHTKTAYFDRTKMDCVVDVGKSIGEIAYADGRRPICPDHAELSRGSCNCEKNYYYSYNTVERKSCDPAKQYGESCLPYDSIPDECIQDPKLVCRDNRCNCPWDSGKWNSTSKKCEKEKKKKFGEKCSSYSDCDFDSRVSCINQKVCGCEGGKVWNPFSNKCKNIPYENCWDTNGCVDNSECVSLKTENYYEKHCECSSGFVTAGDGNSCLGTNGSLCRGKKSCVPGLTCSSNGICICNGNAKVGTRTFTNCELKKYKGEACTSPAENGNENQDNDNCDKDLNLNCIQGSCECDEENRVWSGGLCKLKPGEKCKHFGESVKSSSCNSGTCTCNWGFEKSGLDGTCKSNEDCSHEFNLLCSKDENYYGNEKKCSCHPEFKPYNSSCYPLKTYGERCIGKDEKSDCGITLKCESGICVCDESLNILF